MTEGSLCIYLVLIFINNNMEAELESKRSRGRKWTPQELDLLVAHVEERKKILFSSFNNVVTNSLKRKLWDEITEKINANSIIKRPAKEVKKKWMDYKSQTRKKAAEVRKILQQTGTGKAPVSLTEMELKVVSLIPPCQIEGCAGGMESEEIELIQDPVEKMDTLGHPEASHTESDSQLQVFPEHVETLEAPSGVEAPHIEDQSQLHDASQLSLPVCQGKKSPSDANLSHHQSQSQLHEESQYRLIQRRRTSTTSVKSEKAAQTIVSIEEAKLDVLRQLLEVEKERLTVEKRTLEIKEEKRRMRVFNCPDVSPPFSLSPVIKF